MVMVNYTEFFCFGHNSEGFGHRKTNSKLELAVDSAVGSVVNSAVDAGHSESTDSHTELP